MWTSAKQCAARCRAFFFRSSDLDRDFNDELESHVAMIADENIRRGRVRMRREGRHGSILTKALSGMLFGVTSTDPITFAGMLLILTAVGALAGYLPARRASRIDPMLALRSN